MKGSCPNNLTASRHQLAITMRPAALAEYVILFAGYIYNAKANSVYSFRGEGVLAGKR